MIGVVTGLKSETAALEAVWRGAGFAYFAAGGSAARAAEAARGMAARGARLLISAGLAGGLDPAVRTGDVVLASAVIAPDGRSYAADPAWHERLAEALSTEMRWSDPPVLGSDAAVLTATDKAALYHKTRAAAVDMESHGLAREATGLKIPFVVLRVIADPADRAIPAWAMGAVAADGSTHAAPVLAALLSKPWKLGALLRLARDSRRAHESLGRVALAAGRVLVG